MANGDSAADNPQSLEWALRQGLNVSAPAPNAPTPQAIQDQPPEFAQQGQTPTGVTPQPQQAQQQPPRLIQHGWAGMPLIAQYLHSMITGPQTGVDPQTGQPMRPVSRGDMTLEFLGQFLGNMAQGMAASGHGPGSNIRGAAAAMTAPYQRSLQDWQVQQQAQREQADIAYKTPSIDMLDPDGNPVKVSPAQMGTAIAAQYRFAGQQARADATVQATQEASQAKRDVAATQGQTATTVQGMKNTQAQKSLDEKQAEFSQTLAYKKIHDQLDNDTKLKIANMRQLQQDKAPAAIMQSAVFAGGGLNLMADAQAAMQRLEAKGVMGSNVGQNKAEDWVFGKGLVDPSLDPETRADIGKLRAALGYTSSAAMRAHTGRTSREIYDDFKSRLGAGQDWSALRGAMEETGTMLQHYASAASDENIRSLRQGVVPPVGGAAKTGPLTADEAKEYLRKAGGNKDVARKLATADKRTF